MMHASLESCCIDHSKLWFMVNMEWWYKILVNIWLTLLYPVINVKYMYNFVFILFNNSHVQNLAACLLMCTKWKLANVWQHIGQLLHLSEPVALGSHIPRRLIQWSSTIFHCTLLFDICLYKAENQIILITVENHIWCVWACNMIFERWSLTISQCLQVIWNVACSDCKMLYAIHILHMHIFYSCPERTEKCLCPLIVFSQNNRYPLQQRTLRALLV